MDFVKYTCQLLLLCISIVSCVLHGAAERDAITAEDFYIDNTVIPQIIKDIDKVDGDGSITVHQFVFSDKKLANPLVRAAERGACIKLVLSPNFKNNKESQKIVQKLRDAGVPQRNISYEHTHEKIITIQPTLDSDRIAWIGSRNFSNKAYFQPEVMQRMIDQEAIQEITNIWNRREKGVKPVQPFFSPQTKKGTKRKFDTPPSNGTKVFASEIVSPGKAMVGSLGFLMPTPPQVPSKRKPKRGKKDSAAGDGDTPVKVKRTVDFSFMNVNDDERENTPRENLLEKIEESAQLHPHSQFRVLLDQDSATKKKLVKPLEALSSQPNVDIVVHNPDPKRALGNTRQIMHPKVVTIVDPITPDRSFVVNSTGNPTKEGGSEPNLTVITRLPTPEASKVMAKLRANIPVIPWKSPVREEKKAQKKGTKRKTPAE